MKTLLQPIQNFFSLLEDFSIVELIAAYKLGVPTDDFVDEYVGKFNSLEDFTKSDSYNSACNTLLDFEFCKILGVIYVFYAC